MCHNHFYSVMWLHYSTEEGWRNGIQLMSLHAKADIAAGPWRNGRIRHSLCLPWTGKRDDGNVVDGEAHTCLPGGGAPALRGVR